MKDAEVTAVAEYIPDVALIVGDVKLAGEKITAQGLMAPLNKGSRHTPRILTAHQDLHASASLKAVCISMIFFSG